MVPRRNVGGNSGKRLPDSEVNVEVYRLALEVRTRPIQRRRKLNINRAVRGDGIRRNRGCIVLGLHGKGPRRSGGLHAEGVTRDDWVYLLDGMGTFWAKARSKPS